MIDLRRQLKLLAASFSFALFSGLALLEAEELYSVYPYGVANGAGGTIFASLQEAVDEAVKNGGSSRILVHTGTYRLTKSVTIGAMAPLVIEAADDGPVLVSGAALLEGEPDEEGNYPDEVELAVLVGPLLEIKAAADVRIKGLVLYGGRTEAVDVVDSSEVHLENCVVRDMAGVGVLVTGGQGNTIEDCIIFDTEGAGIVLKGGKDGLVAGNSVWDTGEYDPEASALRVEGKASDIVVRGNWFHDYPALEDGLLPAVYLASGTDGVLVQGNRFERVAGRAVDMVGGRGNRFEENLLVDCVRSWKVEDASSSQGNTIKGNRTIRESRAETGLTDFLFMEIGDNKDFPSLEAAGLAEDAISGPLIARLSPRR
jgi:parallel beta-helix repeat protein